MRAVDRRFLAAGCIASFVLMMGDLAWAQEWAQGRTRLVAVTGSAMQAPDTPPPTFFSALGIPAINDAGDVVFSGSLVGPTIGTANDSGVWLGRDSQTLRFVISEGSGGNIDSEPALINSGKVALSGHQYFWTWNPAVPSILDLVVRPGLDAPGTGEYFLAICDRTAQYARCDDDLLSESGDTAFQAQTSDYGSGLWRTKDGELRLLALEGQQAPGAPAGAKFSSFYPSRPPLTMNSDGGVAFIAATGVPGIWTPTPNGDVTLAVQAFDPAPGLPAGAYFESFEKVALGQSSFAFQATAHLPGGSERGGVWRSDANGTRELIASLDEYVDDSPDIPSERITSFEHLVSNENGSLALLANLSPSGGSGIWIVDTSGKRKLVARANSLIHFSDGSSARFRDLHKPSFNERGDLVFTAIIGGGVGYVTNYNGVFFRSAEGEWAWILETYNFPVAQGDTRKIASLDVQDYRPGHRSLTSSREVAVRARFTDGEQAAFVWMPVPEPLLGSQMLLAIVSLTALRVGAQGSRRRAGHRQAIGIPSCVLSDVR